MLNPDFYLASSEGYGLEAPRGCKRLRQITSNSRNDMLLVEIDPPLIGQKYGLGDRDIKHVIIAPRHQGSSLFPISEWPMFVHVARLLTDNLEHLDKLEESDFESIAWAELYRTENDAKIKKDMSDAQLEFVLSSVEWAFLKQLASRERSLERFMSQQRTVSDVKHVITLTRADAEELRGHLTEVLAKVGFDSNYKPNEQGRVLEALIERFFCP